MAEEMSEFQPGQRVRVLEEVGGDIGPMPPSRFIGKEGTVQYGMENSTSGPPTFYMVEFEGAKSRDNAYAISLDWLESLGRPCEHHWVLDSPSGSFSKGTCRICGEERDFPNSAEDTQPFQGRNPSGAD